MHLLNLQQNKLTKHLCDYLFFYVAIISGMGLSIGFQNTNLLFFTLLFSSPIFYLLYYKKINYIQQKDLSILLVLLISATLFIYFANIQQYGNPYYIGGSDGMQFEIKAQEMFVKNMFFSKQYLDYAVSIDPINDFYPAYGYVTILSYFRRLSFLGEYSIFTPRLFNIFIVLWISIILAWFSKKYFNKPSRLVMYLYALFPNNVYVMAHTFRDVYTSFLVIFMIFLVYQIFENITQCKKQIKDYLLKAIGILVSWILLFWVRDEALAYIWLFVNLLVFLPILKPCFKDKKRIPYFILYLFISLAVFLIIFYPRINAYLASRAGVMQQEAQGLSKAIFETSDQSGLSSAIKGPLLRSIYVFIVPFPGALVKPQLFFNSMLDFFNVLVALGTVVQIYMLTFFIIKEKKIRIFMILYLGVMASIAITTFGFRHYVLAYPYLILVFSYLWTQSTTKQKLVRFGVYFVVMSVLAVIYLVMKGI